MKQYDVIILNALIDKYEKSSVYSGENKVNVRIAFSFTRKGLPDYFDTSSLAFDAIHAQMKELESMDLIQIKWKNNHINHIIDKVILIEENVNKVYQYLKRNQKRSMEERLISIIDAYEEKLINSKEELINSQTELINSQTKLMSGTTVATISVITTEFIQWIKDRVSNNNSIKKYIDINNFDDAKRLLNAVNAVTMNSKECYIREFSISLFGDSKCFEGMIGRVCDVIKTFSNNDDLKEKKNDEILAEFNIYKNPTYVIFKGTAAIKIDGKIISLKTIPGGIGIQSGDLDNISFAGEENDEYNIEKVITVENLTSFHRFQMNNSLIVYLGGFHNTARRELLANIFKIFPKAKYYHFGDIDCGGFKIYNDLVEKTGIQFKTLYMDVETLIKFKKYAKPLTSNDEKELSKMLEDKRYEKVWDILKFMESRGIKLEQECIF